MTDATHVTDLTPAYALGALTASERAFVDAHITDCAECRDDLAQMNGVVSALPFACPSSEPRADLRERILRAAASERHAADMLAARSVRESSAVKPRGAQTVPFWFGVLATAAAIAMGFVAWNATQQRDALRATVAQLGDQMTALRATNASLGLQTERDHVVIAALASGDYWTPGPAKDSNGSMWHCAIVQPRARGHNGMLLASVPAPPRGMAYQVWVKRHGVMHKAAMLMHGGMSSVDMEMPVQHGDMIAFSVEPMQGSAAPSGPLTMEMEL